MSYLNGRLPASALAPIPGGRLRKDAALRWNAMCFYLRAHGRAIPMPNGPMSTYRDLAGQVFQRQSWCARGACQNAAVPGNSNHGWGIAVDTNQGYICDANPQFGFHRRYSDAPWESWHRKWGGFGPVRQLQLGDRTIVAGCKGRDVRALKRLLRSIPRKRHPRLRYFSRLAALNGTYGPAARRGVRAFQRDHGLTVDGAVGAHTLRAMRRAK